MDEAAADAIMPDVAKMTSEVDVEATASMPDFEDSDEDSNYQKRRHLLLIRHLKDYERHQEKG